MSSIEIFTETTKNPLELVGKTAAVCYNSSTDDYNKNIERALNCIESGHGRVLEWVNISLKINCSAKCARELMRHIVGTSVLQSSTRYIDYEKGFIAVTPKTVLETNGAFEVWNDTINAIQNGMTKLKELGVAKEDYTNLLPLAYETEMVWKVNLRCLINFFNQRLCNKAYWEIRELAESMKIALSNYSDEWKIISDKLFVPKCVAQGKCVEKKSCGVFKSWEEKASL